MTEEWLRAARREAPEEEGAGPESFDGLPEGWMAALRYAELMNDSGHAVTEDTYQRLATHWDEGQIVEITAVIGLFAYFNRFNDALRVPVTRSAEPGAPPVGGDGTARREQHEPVSQ